MSLTEKINSVCKGALEKELVGGVVTLRRTAENAAVHALVTKPDQIEETDPLMPYFPGNGADFVKKLTRLAPPRNKKILVILRPCEMRAAVELTKLAQIQNENIVWMTFDCLGTVPRKEFEDKPIPGGDEFYADLNREDIRIIVSLELDKVAKRLEDRQMRLRATDAALDYLAEEGYDPEMGARPVRRVIQQKIEDQLSDAMLADTFKEGDAILVDVEEVENEQGEEVKQVILKQDVEQAEEEPALTPVGI